MQFSQRRALTLLSVLSLSLASAACAGGPSTLNILAALDCGPLIGDELRAPVEGAELPADDTAGAWVAFGDAQTGKLDVANRNKAAVVSIVDGCDRQQRAVREALKPRPWWSLGPPRPG